ncbi:MAG: S-methyl-5-thioribose-1-phosphate isomerase [Thermoprotei archaeon]
MRSIEWISGKVRFIDVTKLPTRLEIVETSDYVELANAIKSMKIRGAPAIGVAVAFGLALVAYHSKTVRYEDFMDELKHAAQVLSNARPTAVNASWAAGRILTKALSYNSLSEVKKAVINEAINMAEEDVKINKAMSEYGASLIKDGDVIITHCNTGMLATVDIGTALGVIIRAHKQGKRIMVYVDETRPALQGARLTAWELKHAGVPFKLIVDSAAGIVMRNKGVTKVFVGADRILRDGHVINKIGTYTLSVLAKAHNVEFYVVAPTSSFDMTRHINEVIIEERDPREVTCIKGKRIAPRNIEVYNPVFDITPPENVTGIITEKGIIYPPYSENIPKILISSSS